MAIPSQTQSRARAPAGIPSAVINHDHLPDGALIKPRDFCALTSWSASTLKRRWKDGTLPEPIRLGPNSLRWRAADVRSFLARLADGGIQRMEGGLQS